MVVVAQKQSSKGEHQNVARAAMVIDALAKAKLHGLRQTDLAAKTGLGSAVIFRLLAGLCAHGFVDHDEHSNRYFLGLKIVSWAASATQRHGLAPFADQSLDLLCDITSDTVYLSLLSGRDSVCVDRREGSYPIKTLTLNLGDQRPLGVGAGSLALLAFQSDEFIAKVMRDDEARRLQFGIDNEFVRSRIALVRELGYALNDGRLIEGMSGVAVPICNGAGYAVAALSVAAVSVRLVDERLDEIIQALKTQALCIEEAAGDVLDTTFAKRYSKRSVSTMKA